MRHALVICIALAFLVGCGMENEATGSQPAIGEPAIGPPALLRCSAQDRSSCSTRGHSFACDNGSWHPPGRTGVLAYVRSNLHRPGSTHDI